MTACFAYSCCYGGLGSDGVAGANVWRVRWLGNHAGGMWELCGGVANSQEPNAL